MQSFEMFCTTREPKQRTGKEGDFMEDKTTEKNRISRVGMENKELVDMTLKNVELDKSEI